MMPSYKSLETGNSPSVESQNGLVKDLHLLLFKGASEVSFQFQVFGRALVDGGIVKFAARSAEISGAQHGSMRILQKVVCAVMFSAIDSEPDAGSDAKNVGCQPEWAGERSAEPLGDSECVGGGSAA